MTRADGPARRRRQRGQDIEEKKLRIKEIKIEGITRRDKRRGTLVGQLAHRTDEERTYEILISSVLFI